MRMIFGVLSLLVVLAIVGMVGRKQLDALGLSGSASTRVVAPASDGKVSAEGGGGGAAADGTVPAQSRAIQDRVRDAANAAVQQGADRSANQP